MNFLAHAYLSFNDPGLIAGNMISDFVKGKKQYNYEHGILSGIILHRAIDSYTDDHLMIKEIKKFFSPVYRLYSGAIADVVLDYFVANDPKNFKNEQDLQAFSQNIYSQLEVNRVKLPDNFLQVLSYMSAQNWLYNYRTHEGLQHSLRGLQRRSRYIADIEPAYKIFLKEEHQIRELYDEFFPDVKKYAEDNLPNFIHTAALSLKA